MGIFILTLEIIGTVAFSLSGAAMGIRKQTDAFGVIILGLVTAVGGGVIRDLILGITPPITFYNPVYAMVSVASSLIMFLFAYFKGKGKPFYGKILFFMDAIGLGVFTVIGVQTAYSLSADYGFFLLLFVGVITGVGGGVMRDVLVQNMPYIFVKHIYAVASLAGAIICILFWERLSPEYAMVLGGGAVFVIRCLSAYFKWSLPKADIFFEG